MKKKQQSSAGPNADHIRDTIRTHFLKAAASEKPPFNLSGRGHEPRVHLSAPLATALRGLELPRVYIAGFGAKYSYPLRVVKRAAASLKKRLHRPVIEFDSHYQTAFLDSHFIPHREPAPEPAICDPSKWTKIGSTNERDISELLLR